MHFTYDKSHLQKKQYTSLLGLMASKSKSGIQQSKMTKQKLKKFVFYWVDTATIETW